MKQYIEVYGEESGYMEKFDSVLKAYQFVKEIKEFDKKHNIKDKYYYQLVVEDETSEKVYDLKVYLRNNKLYAKVV